MSEKCDICLKTKKIGDHMGALRKFGYLTACERCVYSAVHWAYACACKWGGRAYGDENTQEVRHEHAT